MKRVLTLILSFFVSAGTFFICYLIKTAKMEEIIEQLTNKWIDDFIDKEMESDIWDDSFAAICIHIDNIEDHICDNCGEVLGIHADSVNGGDKFDSCGETLSDCTDSNSDDKCDECGVSMGTHIDTVNDGDHKCDYGCGAILTSCSDSNKDHACDECGLNVGTHADSAEDGNHLCEYCGKAFTGCKDLDYDGYCDECSECFASGVLSYQLNGDGCSYTVMGKGSCTSSTIIIPDTYNGLPVTEIQFAAFIRDFKISTVVIGRNVNVIEHSAFEHCRNLKHVNFLNPNGWSATTRSPNPTTSSFVPELLADTSFAAQCLTCGIKELPKQGYSSCNWKRVEYS